MARLPRRVAAHLKATAAALVLPAWPGAAAADLDLAGTWHVLVHYRDARTAHPEAERWEDRLWELEPEGASLRWTEFPIVVFDDETGRFERRAGSGQYARLLGHWEPSPEQLANVRSGLAVNDRGAQTKRLRQVGDRWVSGGRPAAASASVLTYRESWSIEDPEGLPVFTQVDVLGSGSVEEAEGRMELRTEQVLEGGALLVGSYDRDGTRRGTFQMRRSGARKELPRKTQAELQRQGLARSILSSEEARGVIEPIRRELAQSGIELGDAELERLTARAVELLGRGEAPEVVRRRLVEAVREERSAEGAKPSEAPR
jgi:hypothetical protein